MIVALPRSAAKPDSATNGSGATPPVHTNVLATIGSRSFNWITLPSTPVTGVDVMNSTPRFDKDSVARSIKFSGNTGKILGPASTNLILRSSNLTPYFAATLGSGLRSRQQAQHLLNRHRR